MKKSRIVVGISGASGIPYGLEILRLLGQLDVESHLVITKPGLRVLSAEVPKADELSLRDSCDHLWDVDDIAAPIASGSFVTEGMVVAPCSIRTLSAVANSRSSNLLERSADVTLKERRPLVLLVRETPLHQGHLRLMLEASEAGAIIMPPVPAFYSAPKSIEQLVTNTAARVLDLLKLDHSFAPRWGEPTP